MILKYILRQIGKFSLKIILLPRLSIRFIASDIVHYIYNGAVNLPTNRIIPGWYMFEIQLESYQSFTNTTLLFSYANHTEELHIPLKGGRATRRTVLIREIPKHVSLVFNEKTIGLDISHIEFVKIYNWLARLLLKNKLQARHINTPHNLMTLWDLYNKTFIVGEFSTVYNSIYQGWISLVEPQLNSTDMNFDTTPLISIAIYPVTKNINDINSTILSIESQSYKNWEIIIGDYKDQSLQEHINNKNIYSVPITHEEPLYQHLNRCKDIAQGDLIIYLAAGSQLSEKALGYVASYYNKHPEAKIFYSDDDCIDDKGIRSYPRFKPDWNELYFYSFDYISSFAVFNSKFIEPIQFQAGYNGAELYHYVLCCLGQDNINQNEIIHILGVLHHSRADLTGQSKFPENTINNKLSSLQNYLDNHHKNISALSIENYNCIRLQCNSEEDLPLVSLIIPTRDNHELLRNCINSLLNNTSYPELEIIIVNNGSQQDETLKYFSSLSGISHIRILDYPYPFNFSAINNFAVNQSAGTIIGLLNDDTEAINPDWLIEMVSYAVQNYIGCVGAKLYYANGNIQHGGVILGLGDVAGHAHRYFPGDSPGYNNRLVCTQYVSAVTGACLIVRKSIYMEVNGLDEENLTIAYNDVDFCMKVGMAGYQNVWTPHAKLYHYESISRGSENTLGKKLRYRNEVEFMHKKWGNALLEDPYYHLWLTNKREDFSLKF